jgi:hypothetical protein
MPPIEVRELVIKATIVPEGSENRVPAGPSLNSSFTPNEELINTCVEKVLEIIREKNGR